MVGSVSMVDSSTFTSTLDFTTLRTSHGGEYTCQAMADSPMGPGTATTSVIVQIPTLMVIVSHDGPPNNTLPGGSSVTFTCTITIDPAVDTDVTVMAPWTSTGGRSGLSGSDPAVVQGAPVTTYQSSLTLDNLLTSDSGDYTCTATVIPSDPTFITSSAQQSDTVMITVELVVSISIDYTPPPDAVLGPNEYRAATSLAITCEVQGATGTVTYTWVSTLAEVNATTRQRLFLRSSHGGVQTCTATDSGGNSGTASIPVNVVGIGAQINVGDVDGDGDDDVTAALPNNGFVFSLTSGADRFRIFCHSESLQDNVGEIIGLDGTSVNTDPFTVTITNPGGIDIRSAVDIDMDDQGVFTCRLPDSSGTQTLEANFGIYRSDFNTPPSVTGLTYNSTAMSLTCTSTGSPATTVTWEKDGGELTVDGVEYSMTQTVTNRAMADYSNVLTIRDASDIPGVYTCSVSNVLGSSPMSDNLTVEIDIEITAPPQPLTVGGMVTISCTTDLTVSSIQWLFSGEVVAEDTTGQLLELTFDPINDTIHERQYICMATLPGSLVFMESITIIVTVPMPALEVSIVAPGGTPEAGEEYTLTCTVNEIVVGLTNMSTLQWLDPMDSVIPSGSRDITVGGEATESTSATLSLTFSTLRTSHGGQYTCQARLESPAVEGGIMEAEEQDVVVLIPTPAVSVAVPDGPLYNGTEVTLTCTIELNETVDTMVDVSVVWTGPGDVSTDDRITLSEVMEVAASAPTFVATLTFRPLASDHDGSYMCEATVTPDPDSSFIIVNSNTDTGTVSVTALPAPTVDITTLGMSTAGQQYTLTCTVTVVENLVVQPVVEWSGGSTPSGVGTVMRDGATSTLTLTFDPLRTSDGEEYTCTANITIEAAAILSLTNSLSKTVNVQIPPPGIMFSGSPALAPLYEGVQFTLICDIQLDDVVDTDVEVTRRWLRSGTLLTNDSRITVFGVNKTGDLSYQTEVEFNPLRFVEPNDNGNYTCEATVAPTLVTSFVTEVTTNNTFTVEVEALPVPEVQITPARSSFAGEDYTLTCTVEVEEDLVAPPTVTWLDEEGNPVSGDDITVGSTETEGNITTLTLMFRPLHTSHGGRYTCMASVTVEEVEISNRKNSDVIDVTVGIPPPTVTVDSEAGILYARTPSTLTCSIELNQTVDTGVAVMATWTGPGGNTIDNGGRFDVSDVTGSNLMYVATLRFNPLNTTDSGSYTCAATVSPDPSSAFITVSAPGSGSEEITVEALPAPTVAITTMGTSTAGQQYTLTCTVTVVENLAFQPVVEWSGGSTPSGVGNVMRDGATSTLILTFNPLCTSDGGQYTCRASITITEIDLNNASSTDVIVQIPQPTVTVTTMQPTYNGTVFDLTCTIVLDQSVDTGVNVTETWSDSDSTLTTDRTRCINITDTVLVDTHTYQTVLTFDPLGNNMRDGDSYTCQATVVPDPESNYIFNVTGMGDYELSVTALPLPEVTFVPATEATEIGQSYILTCTVTVVENLFNEPDVVWLDPRDSQLNSGLGTTLDLQRMGSTSTLTFTFDSLAPSDAGEYTCRACVSIEKVAIQDHCDSTTAEITFAVPGMLQNFDTDSMSDSEVVVSWDDPEETNGAIVRYEVRVSRYEQRDNFQLELVDLVDAAQNVTAPTTQTTITDLERFTPYSVCVAAANLAGLGEQLCRDFFSRQGAPMVGPRNLAALRLNGTAMRVRWMQLNLVEARGFVESYVITYSPSGRARRKRQESTVEVDGSQDSTIISDLQPGVAYGVSVQARNVENGVALSGPSSEPVTADFEEDTMLFQLQLRGVGDCSSWVVIDTESKAAEIVSKVADETEELCQCGFTTEHITEDRLQCLSDPNEVTFRARLHRTEGATIEELVGYIEQLVERGVTVVILRLGLTVDSTCQPVAIDSFDDPECELPTTPPPTTAASSDNIGAIAGGVVGGILGVVLISSIIILIIILFLRSRSAKLDVQRTRTKKRELVELQEVAISREKSITTTACVAYATTTSQEHQAITDDYEIPNLFVVSNPSTTASVESGESGDHMYDVIPGDAM